MPSDGRVPSHEQHIFYSGDVVHFPYPETDIIKEAFNTSFDRFFSFNKFSSENNAAEPDEDTHQDDGKFDPESDAPNQQSGQGGGQGGGGGAEASGELDFEQLEAQSELGKLPLSGDRMEVMIKMAETGRQVEVNQIVVFTQKGLYTRKIMEAMGLKGLQESHTQGR